MIPQKTHSYRFVAEFMLAGALLLVVWSYVSDYYLASVIHGVNMGFWLTDTSIYLRSGEAFGANVACPDVIGAIALFAASSGRRISWRICGMILSIFFLWLLQATMLLIELKLAQSSVQSAASVHLIRTWSGPTMSLLLWFGFFHSRSGMPCRRDNSAALTAAQEPQIDTIPTSRSITTPLKFAGQTIGCAQPQSQRRRHSAKSKKRAQRARRAIA